MPFKVLLLSEKAKAPSHTPKGYEILSIESVKLQPGVPYAISTGISLSCPKDYVYLLVKNPDRDEEVLGGVVDSDYRGEVKVIMCSDVEKQIEEGEVIGYIQLLSIACPRIIECEVNTSSMFTSECNPVIGK